MGLDSLELLFFCKSVISVATLLLIIRITMYILISLILDTELSWLYLATQLSTIVLVGRSIVNVALLSTFLAVQYL